MSYRVGIGYDIHRLVKNRRLFLGGVEIPFSKGLLGHSDADVVLHAICDALLGAAASGDIGEHFPETDPKYKDIKSSQLLKKVYDLIKNKNYEIVNVDVVIIAQRPLLSPYKKLMQKRISDVLKADEDDIGIKVKTNEGLGEVGRGEAIATYAAVSLTKIAKNHKGFLASAQ